MELRQLRYFLAARELVNFTEAARHLHISQSTLSQQIKQLEEELDIPLFNRIGKRITVTQAGDIFAAYAKKSLKRSEEGFLAMQDLKALKNGALRIGISFGLRSTFMPALKKFTSKYPFIKLDLVFDTTFALFEHLEEMDLDFVLTFQEEHPNDIYHCVPLFSSEMALVTQTGDDCINQSNISLKEVSHLPLALPSDGYSNSRFVMDAFKTQNLKPDIRIRINDIPTLLDLVKLGKVHTLLSETTVSEYKGLQTIPLSEKNMERHAVLIYLKDIYETAAMKAFWEELSL